MGLSSLGSNASKISRELVQTCAAAGDPTACALPPRVASTKSANTSLGSWNDLTQSIHVAPSPRDFTSMAYDPADQEVVLFSGRGCSYSSDCADTWTYSAGVWTQIHPRVSPPAVRGAGLVYDSEDGYLVLFGGMNDSSDTPSQETWSFSAGQWTDRSAASMTLTNTPISRFVGGMADDPVSGYVLLFGGCRFVGCGFPLNDTWSYVSGNWTNITGSVGAAPSVRGGPAIVWDPTTQSVLLYGGDVPSSHLNDTWDFSAGRWTELYPALNPGHRGDAWTVFDPAQGAVFLFGGLLDAPGEGGVNGPVPDTWRWSNGNWTNVTTQITGTPGSLWSLEDSGVYDAADGYGLLFGGGTASTSFNETWDLALISFVPAATAKATPNEGVEPLSVSFSGNATGGTPPYSYSWKFGDSTPNGTGADLLHEYSSAGHYNVTLTVLDSGGTPAYANLSVQVFTPLTLEVTSAPNVGLAPLKVQWSSAPGGGDPPYSYVWDFGDGTPNASGPTVGLHTYASAGNYTGSVQVTDSAGQVAVESSPVEVVPALFLTSESATHTSGDAPLTVDFGVVRAGGLAPFTYEWAFGDGGTSTATAPIHEFNTTGTFNISVHVADALGESSSLFQTIHVAPSLVVSVVAAKNSIVVGSHLYLNASVSGGTGTDTFVWLGLPSGCASRDAASISCVPSEPGTYPVQLTVTDQAFENASETTTVSVQTAPPGGTSLASGSLSTVDWLAIALAILLVAALVAVAVRRRRQDDVEVEADVETAVRDSELPTPAPPPPSAAPPGPALATESGAAVAPAGLTAATAGGTYSMAEQILAHIYGLGRLADGETAPIGFTQEGIAQVLGRPQNVFGKVLTRMEATGLLIAEVRHIQGGGRRRKAYRLSDRGEEAARQVRARMGSR